MIRTLNPVFNIALVSLFLACFCPVRLLALEKWKPGYVVRTHGDTLKGSIFYHHTDKTPLNISFSQDGGANSTKYTPLEISFFSVLENGQSYIFRSFVMNVDNTPEELAMVDTNKNPVMVRDTFFAQLISEGAINLYHYKSHKHGKVHFIVEKGVMPAADLINNAYYLDNSKQFFMRNELFKRQMRVLTADCPGILMDQINQLKFSEAGLVKIASLYNRGLGDAQGYEFQPEKTQFVFGVYAGTCFNDLQIRGNGLDNVKFGIQPTLDVGIVCDMILPKSGKALSMHNEIGYNIFRDQSPAQNISIGWDAVMKEVYAGADYLRMTNVFRYTYPYSTLHPYLEIGLVNGYALSIAEYRNITYTFSNSTSRETYLEVRKYEQSYCVGLGATYKKAGLMLRYEKGNGFSGSSAIGTITTRYHLAFYYMFGK